MSSAVASRLVFLSNLPQQQFGTKVRFLGCVENYDVPTGILHLRHKRSSGSASEPKLVEALVQVDHVLESLQPADLVTGAWLHIIANVGSTSIRTMPRAKPKVYQPPSQVTEVKVDAVIAWNAGSLYLQAYEEALDARIACGMT